jgi:serine/threonine protein kinase
MRCRACQAQNDETTGLCFECGAPLAAIVKGTVVASRYEIQRPLGKGGMGMVYLAHDRELDEPVALKVLRTDMEDSGDLALRFRSEIRLARRVAHKNVCRIFEYGQDAGRQFITMAYIEGIELRRLLHDRGPLPISQAFDVAIHVAEALAAIHDEGIVHRDLKTQNIMLDGKGVVRVMDFGIAKDLDAGAPELTVAGGIVGSPEYMSPERWQGHRADVRSDVYALGVVIYELFTAQRPFRADNVSGWMWQHLRAEPALDALPAPMRPVVGRALAKEMADRFQTAAEVALAIGEARAACLTAATPQRAVPPPLPAHLRPAGMPPLPPRWSGAAVPRPAPRLDPSPTGIPTVSPTAVPTGVRTVHRAPPAHRVPPTPRPPPASSPILTTTAAPARRRSGLAWLIIVGLLSAVSTAVSIFKPEPVPNPPPVTVSARGPAPAPAQPRANAAPLSATSNARQATGTAGGARPHPPGTPRTDVALAGSGTLRLSAVPPAEITIDGARVTGSLRKIVLSPGTHVVRLETPGYQTIQRAVRIRSGEVTSLEIDFAEDGVRKNR